jgi:hypothetical protein
MEALMPEDSATPAPTQEQAPTPTTETAPKEESKIAFNKEKSLQFFEAPIAFKFEDGDDGTSVGLEADLPNVKVPETDWNPSTGKMPWPLCPGVSLFAEFSAGGGVTFGGKVGAKGKKNEDGSWEAEVSGTGFAKAEIFGMIDVGIMLGIPLANLSASAYGKPSLSLTVSSGLTGKVGQDKTGKWTGRIEWPIDVLGELAATVGVRLRGELLWWEKELANFEFGKVVIATAGWHDNIGWDFGAGKFFHEAKEPWIKWGEPPTPQPNEELAALEKAAAKG